MNRPKDKNNKSKYRETKEMNIERVEQVTTVLKI